MNVPVNMVLCRKWMWELSNDELENQKKAKAGRKLQFGMRPTMVAMSGNSQVPFEPADSSYHCIVFASSCSTFRKGW